MRKSKFTESQIVGILNEVEVGMKVADVCRKHGISNQTYYTWKNKDAKIENNRTTIFHINSSITWENPRG